ncbi:glycerophosphodiester phosphodiesterase family protein [Paraburkholderia hayleyella]|uniref:glycerophosphodiester phosphodiesterase family protein n=1 Tax=Paraburkholderia hayleyella TaxID=2152889 RepID=UPI001290D533|nr:glycerophosphodiester phosphodiesterase family protein [Paraburkholderia hayleyella]
MLRSFYMVSLLSACVVSFSACAFDPVDTVASFPRIVAHRGGTGDAPENTLEAIRLSLENHADALWLTVQLSRDGIPVLYRPADLSALTNARGPVADRTAAELAQVNAGWTFKQTDAQGVEQYPYRQHPVGIPTLREALQAIPADMPVVLDMKALPAAPQTQAVAQVLSDMQAWPRVTIYSTEADYQSSFATYTQARMFESRDATRGRLLKVLLNEGCLDVPAEGASVAFELHRPLTVIEKFTLGEGRTEVHATLWTPATLACFKRSPKVKVMAIGVNNAQDYRAAACLGIDSVLADSPSKMSVVRQQMQAGPECEKETQNKQ